MDFRPNDAVFFSGGGWYGSAPQADVYENRGIAIDSRGRVISLMVDDNVLENGWHNRTILSELAKTKIYFCFKDSFDENRDRVFRVLTVVLTKDPLTPDQWDTIDECVRWFGHQGDDLNLQSKVMTAKAILQLYNFYEATGGLAKLNMERLQDELR